MKDVIIGFSKPNTFKIGAKIISMYEHTEFSHVYLRVYTPFADRHIVYQASHGYVNCLTYDNFKAGNDIVAEFIYEVKDEKCRNIIQYCMDHLQTPYSYLGLVEIACKKLFKIKGDGDKGFVCSELAARAMPEFYRGDPDLADPKDLFNALSEKNRDITRIK